MKQDVQVRHNKKVHDTVASSYEAIHTEIYNPTEQSRIARALGDAVGKLAAPPQSPLILDFGAGTGNLTGHLLKLGATVVAADVSPRSLARLKEKYPQSDRLQLLELNGVDIRELNDDSIDMVATYSVLHHVPDYLAAVREFMRVVRPGGIIYIDHEAAPQIWRDDQPAYREYQAALQDAYGPSSAARLKRKLSNIFSYSAWLRLANRKLYGLNEEGDIHVTKDDHIEWEEIERILLERCDVLTRQDYLVCREVAAPPPLHERFNGGPVDIRLLVCRKR